MRHLTRRTTQKLYISYLVSILTNTASIYRLWWGLSPKGLPKSFRYNVWWGYSPIQPAYTCFGETPHQRTTQKLYISYLVRILTNIASIHRFRWHYSPKGIPKSFRYHIWWVHSPVQQAYTGCGEASHQKNYPTALHNIFGEDTHQYSQHILVLVRHLTKRTIQKL